MTTQFTQTGSVFSRRLKLLPRLLCAALFLASGLLVRAQGALGPAPGAGTNSSSIGNPFSRYLSPYEPIYFLLGTYPAAEFQFSLKYQPFAPTNHWTRYSSNFFLAYTQTSF